VRGNPESRTMADELKRVVVWKNLLLDGRDHCALWHTAEGFADVAVIILQLDFADLNERLGVRVLRNVFHHFLRVQTEARLERLN